MNFHTKAISKEKRVEERALFSCQFISKLKKGAWNYLLARGNVKKKGFFDVNFCLRILSFASLLLTQSVLFEQFMIFLKKSFRKKKIFYMESLSLNIILQAGNYMVFGQEITRQIGLKFQGYARKNVKGVMRYFRKEIYAWYYLRWPIHKKRKKNVNKTQ